MKNNPGLDNLGLFVYYITTMKFILTRLGKDKTWKDCSCSLYISTDRTFTVHFKEITPEIGLNDGNFHSIDTLKGVVNNIIVDMSGIHLEGCFVWVNNKWHKDGLSFTYDP